METDKTILTLSWLVMLATLIVLVVALGKFGVVTGFSTSNDTGDVNLSITAQASLRFTTSTCNFGSGSVEEESIYATAWSNATSMNATVGVGDEFKGCSTGLVVRNDGDVDLSVDVESSLTAAEFIGGNRETPAINVKSSDTTAVNCTSGGGSLQTTYVTIAGGVTVCDNLDWKNVSSEGGAVRIDFELIIPEDADPGDKGTIITATGTSI